MKEAKERSFAAADFSNKTGILEPNNSIKLDKSKEVTHEELQEVLGSDYRKRVIEHLLVEDLTDPHLLPDFRDSAQRHIYEKDGRVIESDSLYIVDYYHGEDRILAYCLPSGNSKTSKHYHNKPIEEEYRLVAGESILHKKNGPFSEEEYLPVGEIVIVKPGTIHRARTKNRHALTVVVMRNARGIPEDKQHIQIPDSSDIESNY